MPTKVKKIKSQSDENKRQNKKDLLTTLEGIADKYSFKHLKKIIEPKDLPIIIALVLLFYIFSKGFPYAVKQKDFLGLPYMVIFIFMILIVLIFILIVYLTRERRKPN